MSIALVSPTLLTVGPLSLGSHLLWFAVLSLGVFLIYNGLRVESVGEAIRTGIRRWIAFVIGAGLLAVVGGLLAELL